MTEEIMSPKLAPKMKPEYVTAVVAWMCSEESTLTGEIIEAGMGYYSKVQIVEAPGYIFKGDEVPTPEQIRDHWGEISDMTGAEPYPGADDVIRGVFAKLKANS